MTTQDRIHDAARSLPAMPAHSIDPTLRPVVVVAWTGRRRPWVGCRYHAEPVGSSCRVDGFDHARVVAE